MNRTNAKSNHEPEPTFLPTPTWGKILRLVIKERRHVALGNAEDMAPLAMVVPHDDYEALIQTAPNTYSYAKAGYAAVDIKTITDE